MIAVAATAPAAAAPAAAATTYTVTDLGSLGEGVSDASGINATGQATGHSYLTKLVPTPACPPVYGNTKKTCVEHPWHAFFYSNGQMTDLGTVSGGNFSEGLAINRAGQVAGESSTNKGGEDAFLWNGQKMIDLGGLKPLAGSNSDATGINDAGQVVGSYGNGSTGQAFLYSNGAQNLNTLLPARPTRSRKPPASTTTARSSPTPPCVPGHRPLSQRNPPSHGYPPSPHYATGQRMCRARITAAGRADRCPIDG